MLILIGLPYSGKTTLARQLSKVGFVHVWATKLKKEMGFNDKQMLAYVKKGIEYNLREGRPVVFDFLNHTNRIRKAIIDTAKKTGSSYEFVFLDTPLGIIMSRQRKQKRGMVGRTKIDQDTIMKIKSESEIPKSHLTIIRTHRDYKALLRRFSKKGVGI